MTTEKIPGWIERLLMPKLSEIGGDVKALDAKIESLRNETKTEIASVRNEIASLRTEIKTEIEGLRKEIKSNRKEMLSKFEGLDYRFETINIKLDSLEKRIPVIEEITALKLKIADIEKRLAVA